MPENIVAIVVGGGAEFVAPITIGNIPQVNTISPPTLNDSLLRDVATVGTNLRHIAVGATDPPVRHVTTVEELRTNTGIISSFGTLIGSVVMGEGATVLGPSNTIVPSVAIGLDASAGGSGGVGAGSVCIGFQAQDGGSGQPPSVVIGGQATGASDMVVIGVRAFGQGSLGVVIGNGANNSNASDGFAIGHGATQLATDGMALGNAARAGISLSVARSVAIGPNANAQGGDSLSLGSNSQALETSFFAEQTAVGALASCAVAAFQSVALGYSTQANHDSAVVIGSRISSDFARQFKVGFGAGGVTGLPIYGVFIGGRDQYASYEGITYRHVNGSGTDNSVGPLQFISPLGTGNGVAAVGGLTAGIEFYTAAVPVASGSAVQAQALNFKVLPQGATPTNTDAPIALPNYFDGANGQVGTLNNAPKIGDPQAWVPVNLKGVVHWFPAWHL